MAGDFPGGSVIRNPPAMQEPQETWVQSPGQEDPLEDGNPLQYSCLKHPMTEEPGRLQSQGHKESDTTEATEHAHKHGINNPTASDFQYSH